MVDIACSSKRTLLALAQEFFEVKNTTTAIEEKSLVMSCIQQPTIRAVLEAARIHWPELPHDTQVVDDQQFLLEEDFVVRNLLACGARACLSLAIVTEEGRELADEESSEDGELKDKSGGKAGGAATSGEVETELRDANNVVIAVQGIQNLVSACCTGRKELRSSLLLTYPTYQLTTKQLLAEVINFFLHADADRSSASLTAGRPKSEARAMALLNEWSATFPQDFLESGRETIDTLLAFLDDVLSIRYPFGSTMIKNRFLLFNSTQHAATTASATTVTVAPLNPVPPRVLHSRAPDVLKWEPLVIAQQLTLIEWSCFLSNINPRELLGTAWSKPDKLTRAPTVIRCIGRFNQVAHWTAAAILGGQDAAERTLIFKKFLEIAEGLVSLRNYNTLCAIVAGLGSQPIARLSLSLSEMSMKTLATLQALVNPLQARKAYRAHFDGAPHPKIPFLASVLGDLTFLEEMPDQLEKGGVNYLSVLKRERVYSAISQLTSCQQVPYNLVPYSEPYSYLLIVRGFANHDDSAFQLSKAIQANDAKQQETILRRIALDADAETAVGQSLQQQQQQQQSSQRFTTPRDITVLLLENQCRAMDAHPSLRFSIWTKWENQLQCIPAMFSGTSAWSSASARESVGGYIGAMSAVRMFEERGRKRQSLAAAMAKVGPSASEEASDSLVLLQALLSSDCLDTSVQLLFSGHLEHRELCLRWMKYALTPSGCQQTVDSLFEFFNHVIESEDAEATALRAAFFHVLRLFRLSALLLSSPLLLASQEFVEGCALHELSLPVLNDLVAAPTTVDLATRALGKLTTIFDWVTSWHNTLADDRETLKNVHELFLASSPGVVANMGICKPSEAVLRLRKKQYLDALRELNSGILSVVSPLQQRIERTDKELASSASPSSIEAAEPLPLSPLCGLLEDVIAFESPERSESAKAYRAFTTLYQEHTHPFIFAVLTKADKFQNDLVGFIEDIGRRSADVVRTTIQLRNQEPAAVTRELRAVCQLILSKMHTFPDLGTEHSPEFFLRLSAEYHAAFAQ